MFLLYVTLSKFLLISVIANYRQGFRVYFFSPIFSFSLFCHNTVVLFRIYLQNAFMYFQNLFSKKKHIYAHQHHIV